MPHSKPVELTPRRSRALLEQRLRTERLAPAELRALLAASDPEEVHAALLHLKRRLERLEGGDTPSLLMDALPTALGACAPESQVLLAELARLLPADVPVARLASLSEGRGPRPVEAEVAWLVTEVLREPGKLAAHPEGTLLLRAVQQLNPADASDAEALVEALCAHPDPEVQLAGLRHLVEALDLGLVTLTHALALVARALEATDARVALHAAELLAAPWAARADLGPSIQALQTLLGRSERLAIASLRALARRGESSALRLVLEDERQLRAVRREAMALLAPFAGQEELRLSLLVSRQDPLFFGPTCAGLLQTLYRRGVRCEPDDVPLVSELFLSSPAVAPDVIAEVLSLRQREYVDPLWGLPATDADFPRHLALLRELDSPEALNVLRALLVRPDARPLWPEVIEALGHQGQEVSEEAILGSFDAEPWACLEALRHLGGERTVEFLRSHPGLTTAEWRAEALDLVTALDDTPPTVISWPAEGEPGREVFASLQPVYSDAAFAEVSRIALQTQHPLRLQAIGQLGRESRRRALVPLGELLLDADESVRSAAHQAITDVGRGLHASGRVRPRALLACASEGDAGALVLAECLLDQLQQRDLSDAQLERVLGQLVGRRHPALARRLRRFLRHGSVHVQKLALECLARSGDSRAVAWLVPFARSEDIYRLRQALSGLGELEVEWAVPLLAAGLDHPNMNIKKTAAEALSKVGPGWPAPVGAMLGWLRRHDNPGLRESLVRALRAACGRGYVATVLHALQEAASPREQGLLCEALSGVLSPRALVALLRRGTNSAKVLLDAVQGGVLELPGDALAELAVLLRRHGLSHWLPATSDDPELARLLRERRLDADLAWMDDVLSSGDAAMLEAAEEDFTKLLSAAASVGLTDSRAAVLKRHLEVLRALLAGPKSAPRRLALSLLTVLAARLSEPERVGALADVRRAWADARIEPHEALAVMHRLGAVPSVEEARMASALPDERVALWGAERLVLAGELSGPRLLEALVQARAPAVRRFFVPHALREVPPLQVLDAVARGPHPDLLETVRKEWGARVPEEALLAALVQAAESAAPAKVGTLIRWMGDMGTEAARAALRRLARHHEHGLAMATLSALGMPTSDEDEALFVDLLSHAHVEVRRQAARQLWRVRGLPRLQSLLEDLGDERPLRWVPPGALERVDLEALRELLGSVEEGTEGELWLESLVELLEGLRPATRLLPAYVTLLLDVWRLGRGRSGAMAADTLRSLPATRVLPFILPMLREGHTAALEVLASEVVWSPELLALFTRARGLARTHFLELLQRGASAHAIEGRTLEGALFRIVHEDEDHREAALRVLGGLASWGLRDEAFRMGTWLIDLANRKEDASALAALLGGLERQGPEVRSALLVQVTTLALRADVVAALAPILLDDPSLDRNLTPELLRDVERRLETLAWEVPEPDPRALEWMALRRAPHVVERLTGLLSHRKSAVRLRAHRLLRALVSRAQYLEVTRELLKDPEAGHVVRAIRTLAFGGHRPAVAELAALLHDRRNPVARAALEGLLVMGDAALPLLRGEFAHARPDRRAMLARVITSLEEASEPRLRGAGTA
jgi:HEAT repeat protein